MRCITYAGENFLTTDEIASALVELTAALARQGLADAVKVPIVFEDGSTGESAEMVIGVGNDVLSVPYTWKDEQPDFSDAVQELKSKLSVISPRHASGPKAVPRADEGYDWDFDQI